MTLEQLVQLNGGSRSKTANLLGTSAALVTMILNKKRTPSLEVLKAIARVTNSALSEIVKDYEKIGYFRVD